MATDLSGQASTRNPGVIGVHSIDHFAFTVPSLAEAKKFYSEFGLDVRDTETGLDLYTFGHPHRWATVREGSRKRLDYISFGVFEDDLPIFRERLAASGVALIDPPFPVAGNGLWFRNPDGLALMLQVAEKCSPDEKAQFDGSSVGPGESAAVPRSKAPRVHPRRLSHFLVFSGDVARDVEFYSKTIGLKLSDQSPGIVAFLHGVHGSDHHLLALAKSEGYGMHHSSWDVGSVQEVGLGAAHMASKGYDRGWGLGRHVLGANYFHYVRDPWGSYAEYSSDIDYIPAGYDWRAADHPPEDSLYLWGPPLPEDFITNYEFDPASS